MKTCSNIKCTQTNPQNLNNFYSDRKSPDNLRAQCKSCVKIAKRKYHQKHRIRELDKLKKWKALNPDKVKAGNLRNLYGITPDEYQNLLSVQNQSCSICKKHKDLNIANKRKNKSRDLAVDHCHKTGKIRGLLCYYCNLAIGMLKDDINSAQELVKYLRYHEKES